jgi:hypothetical protein
MKIIRNLSGIYFRLKNEVTKKWDNICFEDLSEIYQDDILKNKDIEYLKSLVKLLANTINKIGDEFDVISD